MKHLVAPSILAADFANLGRDVKLIEESDADWVHIDVMDGHFVPNFSFGQPVIQSIRSYTEKTFDVHLMVIDPERYFEDFKKAGADLITIHYEACTHLHSAIQKIRSLGMKAGVALNPHTPVSVLEDIIQELDLVLVMSVNPGFGGQKFIPHTLDKCRKMKQLIVAAGSSALIEVDGGVGLGNAAELLKAGADVLVAGSSVYKSDDPKQTITALKNIDVNTIHV